MSRQPKFKIEVAGKYREFLEYEEALTVATHLVNMNSNVRKLGFSRPEQLVKNI